MWPSALSDSYPHLIMGRLVIRYNRKWEFSQLFMGNTLKTSFNLALLWFKKVFFFNFKAFHVQQIVMFLHAAGVAY